jgi:hypothetical protein
MVGNQFKAFIAGSALLLLAGPAFADAIDGNWCHDDGRRFTIRGPEIVTPGGKRMEGNYSRHWFSYTVPATERDAGQAIFMTLLNENTVQVRRGEASAGAPQETWVRCGPSVSAVEVLPKS